MWCQQYIQLYIYIFPNDFYLDFLIIIIFNSQLFVLYFTIQFHFSYLLQCMYYIYTLVLYIYDHIYI